MSRAVKPVKCGGWPREAATQSPSRYVLHQLLKPQSARGRSVRLAEIPPCVSAHTHIITARAHGPKPAHCGRLKRLPHRIGRKKSQSVALSSRSRRSLVALTSHEIRTPTALPHTAHWSPCIQSRHPACNRALPWLHTHIRHRIYFTYIVIGYAGASGGHTQCENTQLFAAQRRTGMAQDRKPTLIAHLSTQHSYAYSASYTGITIAAQRHTVATQSPQLPSQRHKSPRTSTY